MEIKSELGVVTWNINGIRSFPSSEWKALLDSLNADIICIQETKVTRNLVEESFAILDGYYSFFSFCKSRIGYSGVATFCKASVLPLKAEEGLTGILAGKDALTCYGTLTELSEDAKKQLDAEGRAVLTQHQLQGGGLVSILNVYCPHVEPARPERLEYKLQFYEALQARAQALRDAGSHVIILGDLNCSHRPIDHCDPGDLIEFVQQPSRQWLETLLHDNEFGETNFKMVDTFRHLNPNTKESYTCWNTSVNARSNNFGTRIDYILCDTELSFSLNKCQIMSEVLGSDHCPVRATFKVNCQPASKAPALCTRFFPEFAGTQQTLHAFLRPTTGCLLSKVASEKPKNKNQLQNKRQADIKKFFAPKIKKSTSVELGHSSKVQVEEWEVWPESVDVETSACEETREEMNNTKVASVSAWKSVLRGPRAIPLCRGHKEKCVIKTVKKKGPNFNQQFYTCAYGKGHKSDPKAHCDYFEWVKKK